VSFRPGSECANAWWQPRLDLLRRPDQTGVPGADPTTATQSRHALSDLIGGPNGDIEAYRRQARCATPLSRPCVAAGARCLHVIDIGVGATGVREYSSCMPHEKAERVRELMESGETVIMVGDGVNDAPALASASVGVSMGVTDLASEAADVVILSSESVPAVGG
jgi:hypothetical protein